MAELASVMPETPAESPPDRHPLTDEVLRCYTQYKAEAEQARTTRLAMNRRNLDVYHSYQDTSTRQEGQSTEFLPKTLLAVEQFVAVLKRAMTDFGDWFQLSLGLQDTALPVTGLQRLLRDTLGTLSYNGQDRVNFPTVVADALKVGCLESLMILKIHGRYVAQEAYHVQTRVVETPEGARPTEQLVRDHHPRWQLCVDVVDPNDWYPDPAPVPLYVIHETRQPLHYLHEMADLGEFDPEVVAQVATSLSAATRMDEREPRHRGEPQRLQSTARHEVRVAELWGTLLTEDGRILADNIFTTIVNDEFVVRPPTPNPYWHNQSPFVACPLRRVPFSTWHKALFDEAAALNGALNDMMNLMIDGGLQAVWGVQQLRADWLEQPSQVSHGVAPGTTLLVRAEVPPGAKVMEPVRTGDIPADAFRVYDLLEREFQGAAMTNDLAVGQIPTGEVKATAMVEAQQARAGLLDGVVKDVEDGFLEPALRKAWLLQLQFLDDLPSHEVQAILGPRATLWLATLTPAQRFALFSGANFTVSGLSAVMARMREFQKLVALGDLLGKSPVLGQAFLQRYDPAKLLQRMLRAMNIDAESMEFDQGMGSQGGPPQPSALQGGQPPSAPSVPTQPERPPIPEIEGLAGAQGGTPYGGP